MNELLKNNSYDGILRKPFLAEHWHKGFAAGLALWLPAFLFIVRLNSASTELAAALATVIGLIIFLVAATHHEGFALDLIKRRFRSYVWIGGLKFGTWQSLPPIASVIVRPYSKKHYLPLTEIPTDSANTGFVATERGWQVLLSVVGKPIGITAAITSQSRSKLIASRLADVLAVPINTA